MRVTQKRTWTEIAVNMTPLIDVVFLIIIFFILMINFSEMHLRDVNLPKADQAQEKGMGQKSLFQIIIKSKDEILLDGRHVSLENLAPALRKGLGSGSPKGVQIQGDEKIPYALIRGVLQKVSTSGIGKIEFTTLIQSPEPLQEP